MKKIKTSKILKILLYIIVIGCENCFYLIDRDSINIAGIFNYNDIFILLSLIFCAMVFLIYRKYPKCKYKFKWIILSIIGLSIYSSIQSQILYGQEFIVGLRPQRFWIIWGLLYFPIRRLLYLKELTIEDIKKMVYVIGTIEIILYSLQYIMGNSFKFLYVNVNNRYGQLRFYFNNIFLRILLFINLNNIFQKKKMKSSIIYIVAILFILMIVGKMRMTTLATLLSMAFGILIWRKGGNVKIGFIILALIASIFLYNTDIVQDTITTIFENSKSVTDTNLVIREEGRKLYLNSLKNHPILGCGYPSILNYNASEAAGFNDNIFLVDNGLYGYIYIYGTIGILWLILFFGTLLKNGWKIFKNNNVYFPLLTVIGWIIAGQTEALWYWDNGFIFVVILLVSIEQYLTMNKDSKMLN